MNQDLSLTRDPRNSYLYYPCNPFVTNSSSYYESELNSGKMEVIGKIKSEGEEYNILGGSAINGSDGGSFCSDDGVGFAYANFGFLGCATIADISECLSQKPNMVIWRISKFSNPSIKNKIKKNKDEDFRRFYHCGWSYPP